MSAAVRLSGLDARVARRKPLLGERHSAARLQFEEKHLKDPQTLRSKMIWSEETKVESFACSPPGQYCPHSEAWSCQLQVVGYLSAAGTGRLVRREGMINSGMWRDILDENLLQGS